MSQTYIHEGGIQNPAQTLLRYPSEFRPLRSLTTALGRRHIAAWCTLFVLVYIVGIIKLVTWKELHENVLFGGYSLAVTFHIFSRFVLSRLYAPETSQRFEPLYEPTISFGVPSKNEGDHIRETLLRIAASDYPKDKIEIVAVNDGSTDTTLQEMKAAQKIAASMGVRVAVVDWKKNRGKREGMAECVKQSKNDIIIFIDSDSFVEPDTARELVKYFCNPNIAAVAGNALVANAEVNMLTKMQAVRYYISFTVYKAAEALFGAVTCCSGCCAAYRRSSVLDVVDSFTSQKLFGVKRTYGDDRSLTNFLLERGYACVFSPTAVVSTFVPETFRQFAKQQLRWKKSWTIESVRAMKFLWKRNPIASSSFYLGVILSLLTPIIMVRALVWYPIQTGRGPWFYLSGLMLMAGIYGMYYYMKTKDRKWIYGTLFTVVYSLILTWQLPYALLTLRDSRWGTR